MSKLRNGLFKISDTREKVEVMSAELEEAKKQAGEVQKQCDQYMSVIVQQKGEADKQQTVGTTNSETVCISGLFWKRCAVVA